jgi:NAD(P)-dependent dehydrogenase (short-subunit alcohol dehydrogenase family)
LSSEQTVMSPEQKVAIITGASQGIGAGAVLAYRKLGYAVVANSRHITAGVAAPLTTRAAGIVVTAAAAMAVGMGVGRFV